MLRKTTAAVVLAGALALGTASATSLGSFDNISFAASDVGLLDCEVVDSTLELVPDLDADISLLNSLGVDSFTLDAINVDIAEVCWGKVADVALIDDTGTVLEQLTGTAGSTGITFPDLDVDNTTTTLHSLTDVSLIEDVRIVVRDATA